jgi:hypothetical protein
MREAFVKKTKGNKDGARADFKTSEIRRNRGDDQGEGDALLVVPWLEREGPAPEEIGNGQRQQISLALRPVPLDLHSLLPLLTDTHNHMAGCGPESRRSFNKIKDKIESGAVVHAKEYCVMSVEPQDWQSCADWSFLSETRRVGLRQAIGIHPQCADEFDPSGAGWLNQMRRCLRAAPWAFVGEIGLDKNSSFKDFLETHQREIFRKQLEMAAELRRPVSVHSVKADGVLLEILETEKCKNCDHPIGGTSECRGTS